jgi:hypothetical protein
MVPGDTWVYDFANPTHRRMLARTLYYADTIIGKDVVFDIIHLRRFPALRAALDGFRHTLIDVSWLNFLQCEVRPERALKNIGPVLGKYRYDPEATLAGGHRYLAPFAVDANGNSCMHYNAEDTHNSILAAAEFAARIIDEFPDTDKLSPFCLTHFSELQWTAVRMSEAGVPVHRASLVALERSLTATVARCDKSLAAQALQMEGRGSDSSRRGFIEKALDHIDETIDVAEAIEHESVWVAKHLVHITKTGKVSMDETTRATALHLLPKDDTIYRPALELWNERSVANTLITRHTCPLLRYKRPSSLGKMKDKPLASKLVPSPLPTARALGIELAYPSWFVVPSAFKDDRGGPGGQRQGRMSASSPPVSQWNVPLKRCVRSRFYNGSIVAADLSQIELRVAAVCSGEPTMLDNYAHDGDLHGDRAVFVFGPDVVNDPAFHSGDMQTDPRQWAKRFNFEDLYWAGAKKMQEMLLLESGVFRPIAFFYEVVDSRSELRPTLYAWQRSLVAKAHRDGVLILPFTGHSRSLIAAKPNEAVNFPVQTIAAVTMVAVQRELHRLLPALNHPAPPCYLITNWYDANYFDCAPSFLSELKDAFAIAIHHVAHTGYWAQICSYYGHYVPLKYELKSAPTADAAA